MKVFGSFIWTIETWKSSFLLERGKSIQSRKFLLQENDGEYIWNHEWNLSYYPNGQYLDKDKSVFKLYYIFNESIEIIAEISLLDHKHNKVLSKKSPNVCVNSTSYVDFPNFFDETCINQNISKLLKEDKIVILCEIAIVKRNSIIAKSLLNSMKLEPCDGLNLIVEPDKFENLLENKKFSDVVFKVGENEIYLHKIILASKSPVFSAMFEHDVQENKNNAVKIVDVEYTVLKEMLRFIYTGKVNAIENIADELLVAADKYCIEKLKKECETILSRCITLDNVVACLDLAIHCNTSLLKKKVIEFILSNKKLVVSKPEFKLLVKRDSDAMLEVMEAMANSN